MNPHVALGMKLRGLLHAFHRGNLRQHLFQQSHFIQQLKRAPRRTFRQHLCKFFAQTLWRDLLDFRGMPLDRSKRGLFDFEAEPGGKANSAHHAQLVLREPEFGIADGANHSRAQILLAAYEVQYPAVIMSHQQAVDGEVPALYVFLRRIRINHAVRVPAVAVAQVRAEGRDFHFQTVLRDQDHAELRADGDALWKKSGDFDWCGIGSHIVVGGFAPQQKIAHTPAH